MKKLIVFFLLLSKFVTAQKANDVTTPLHALQPDYPVPYGAPKVESVKAVLDRVYNYLDRTTPMGFVDRNTGNSVSLASVDTNSVVKRGDFRLTSYEWGVTYSGMLEAGAATGDPRFSDYTRKRVDFIVSALPAFKKMYQQYPKANNPFRQPIAPHALDDAGAMCAAMIKTLRSGGNTNIRPLVDH